MLISQLFQQLTQTLQTAVTCKADGIRGQAETRGNLGIAWKWIFKE